MIYRIIGGIALLILGLQYCGVAGIPPIVLGLLLAIAGGALLAGM